MKNQNTQKTIQRIAKAQKILHKAKLILTALAVMMTYTVIWNPSQAKMTKSKDVKKVEVTNVQDKNITLGKGKKLKLSVNVILKKGSKASKAVKFVPKNRLLRFLKRAF